MNIQKTKKNKSLISVLVLALMVLSILLPNFAYAEPTNNTVDLTINVQKYLSTDKLSGNEIKNDGTAVDTNKFTQYNTAAQAKYGPVKFAIYELNETGTKEVTINNDKVAVAGANLKTALKGTEANRQAYGTIVKQTTKTELSEAKQAVLVNEKGVATLKLTGVDKNTPKVYAIVETDPEEKGKTIVQKAEPIVLSLPHFNQGVMVEPLNIAAKNQVETDDNLLKATITKIGETNKVIPSAKFKLYKEYKSNEPAVLMEEITTNAETGKAELKGLTPGTYYLVEEDSEYVRNPFKTNTTNKTYLIDEDMVADANNKNKYFFKVTDTGVEVPADSKIAQNFEIKNYFTPRVVKELVKNKNNTLAPGKTATFKVSVLVPGNIDKYKSFKVVDDRTKETLGEPTKITSAENLTITSAPDATNELTDFVFDINELKNHAGKVITFTYDMMIKETAKSGNEISNKVWIEYELNKETPEKPLKTDETEPNGSKIVDPNPNPLPDPFNPQPSPDPSVPTPTPTPGVKVELTKLNVQAYNKGITLALRDTLKDVTFVLSAKEEGKTVYYQAAGKWVDNIENAKKFTTTENDTVIDGLVVGEKYTVELVEPMKEGYRLLGEKLQEITLVKDEAKNRVEFNFTQLAGLPLTGSEQLIILGIVGIAIIATAVAVLRKKENK